jgi:hypothetical protein
MKTLGFAILAVAVLGLPLCAQHATLRADVPFEFGVRSTTAPPGTYVIRLLDGPLVQLQVGNDCYYFHANSDSAYSPNSGSQEPKLVFNRYEDQYFLSQIWTGATKRDVPMSRTERELRKNTTAAARPVRTEVLLAMR